MAWAVFAVAQFLWLEQFAKFACEFSDPAVAQLTRLTPFVQVTC